MFLTGNALEMLCVNRFLFRKDNISVFLYNVIMELFCHVGLRYVVECFRHAVLVPGFYLILMFLSVSGIQTSNLCVIIIL